MAQANLLSVSINQEVEIVSFTTSQEVERQLATMSLVAGVTIKLLQKHKNGSVIIAKNNIRLALCAATASNIIIKVKQ